MGISSCVGFWGKQIDEKSSRYRKTPFGIVYASFDEASTDKWLNDVDEDAIICVYLNGTAYANSVQ